MSSSPTGSRLDWLFFVLLGFFWGSSYLFIKIGVDAGLQPFTLVMLRLLIGLVLLASVVLIAREQLPRGWRVYGHLSVMGFFSIALPFSLITWAERSVDSALAATLTAPVPIFVIPIAALLLRDERLSLNRVLGVVLGLIGVAVLVGFDPGAVSRSDLLPQIALVGAAVSYAIGGVYARRNVRGYRPMIPALFQVATALVMVTILAFAFERPMELQLTTDALVAIVWLGLLGSGLAFLVFFRLLGRWGATRTSLVAYLLPVWGIALGAIVLNEAIHAGLLLGTALILAGIALVNAQATTDLLRAARGRAMGRLRGTTGTSQVDPAAGPR